MTSSVKVVSSSMVLTVVATEKGRVPEASKRGSSLWRLAVSISLSLACAAMEESPLPNAQTNRFFFPLLFCCWVFCFFFFCFSLAVCLSVSIPMTGFSFAYLPARGPANAGDRCILSIRAAVQFAAFRIRTTCTWSREWRRGGKESIASLAGGKLEIQLTIHRSLSLSLCGVDLMWARQLRWDDVVMCSSFWIITALVSKETSFFLFFFSSFCKVLVYCSLWFSAFFHHHLWPVRT